MKDALDAALDDSDPGGVTVEVVDDGGRVVVECDAVERIGVRVRRIRVEHPTARDIAGECGRLARDVRHLPEALVVTEVDPGLGGGVLRTDPDALDDAFTEATVRPDHTEVTRHRLGEHGERTPIAWDTTRGQLRRVIRGLRGPEGSGGP